MWSVVDWNSALLFILFELSPCCELTYLHILWPGQRQHEEWQTAGAAQIGSGKSCHGLAHWLLGKIWGDEKKKRKIQFTFLCIVCVAHYTENLLTHIQACMWGDVRVKVHAALLWLVLVRCSSTPQHSPRSRLVSLTSIFCCFCQQRDFNCNPTVTKPRFLLLSQIHPKITFRIHHQHYLYHHHTKH